MIQCRRSEHGETDPRNGRFGLGQTERSQSSVDLNGFEIARALRGETHELGKSHRRLNGIDRRLQVASKVVGSLLRATHRAFCCGAEPSASCGPAAEDSEQL